MMPDTSIVDKCLISPYGGYEMSLDSFVRKMDDITLNAAVEGNKIVFRMGYSALSSHCVTISEADAIALYSWLYLAITSLKHPIERKV